MWLYQYKVGTKHRRITIGSAAVIPLAKAKSTATDLYAKVRLGQDPAGARVEARRQAGDTFAAVRTRYLVARRGAIRPKTYVEVERYLTKHCAPLDGLQVRAITRANVAERLAAINASSGAVSANRARTALSSFLGWCAREGLVDNNAAAFTNVQPEQSRDRVLADCELDAIWHSLPVGHFGDIVRLLLLTGQRAKEIGDLQWSEIDLAAGQIRLPGSRTKNGRPHIVPLSTAARAILEAQPRRAGRDLVFGVGRGGFNGFTLARRRLDAKLRNVDHWVIHDLRRTCASGMARLGVLPHIIEAVLNHIGGSKAGPAGIYNRETYEPEKRAALDLWAAHVMSIING